MLKTMAVLWCLLMALPSLSKECFEFEDIFATGESEAEVNEKLSQLENLMARFFYLRGEDLKDIASISWNTARELSHFLRKQGFEIEVREDIYNEEKESLFVMVGGGALLVGHALGQYVAPQEFKFFKKFALSKKAIFLLGFLWRGGAALGAWLGGRYIFGGSCEMSFVGAFRGGVPLRSLGFDESGEGDLESSPDR